MLTPSDLTFLQEKGITKEQIEEQLASLKNGFPFLKIKSSATIGKGIDKISAKEIEYYINEWENYLQGDKKIIKFVPASGAASRMFKDLFSFLDGKSNVPTTDFEKYFFNNIRRFAFYGELDKTCRTTNKKTIDELMGEQQYKTVVSNLLNSNGLNYGELPKGLLKFHTYTDEIRTPTQEHLIEGVLYAKNGKNVAIHFTVSGNHKALFKQHIDENIANYQKKYDTKFDISFSEQKPSTDTIAVDNENEPFREDGQILFRPGGHGALIENLNDLDGDVIFIKNIDNVVPDRLKEPTVEYKKLIAGILVSYQKQVFEYLNALENNSVTGEMLIKIAKFCEKQLNNQNPDLDKLVGDSLRNYLINKLNRPIRVCGMVKNEGEPGGGPFLIQNKDGSISPQILESTQIDQTNPSEKSKMDDATHFNPVDLVCGVKNYKGEKFNLLDYVDKSTGFISLKSKSGRDLKALELPGLWNGAMSNWNTIFVEVPIETFNPVKTVNDLLRMEHQ